MLIWRLAISVYLVGSSLLGLAADDKLMIISPHRKSIQDEFIPKFVQHYEQTYKKKVRVDWLDQGGTENELRYVMAKYEKDPKTSGLDLFWGGGDVTFIELENHNLLEKYKLPATFNVIPNSVSGIMLRSPKEDWYGTALSSFGLFFNRKLLKAQKLPEPVKWADLGKPEMFNHVIAADPRRSSTAMLMSLIMLESAGWEKGWQLLFAFAGNTRSFTQSSSDPIKAVVSGDASVAPAVDFYASSKVSELGTANLGFTLPIGETLFNSDPIGILKGAPNRLVAERFVQFILSEEGQKIFILEKGMRDGPQKATLARIGVNPLAYKNLKADQKLSVMNPFEFHGQNLKISFEKLAASKKLLADLIGALHIDNHQALKKAWEEARNSKDPKVLAELAAPPFTEKELGELLKKWDDNIFRNRKINEWINYAQAKYKKKLSSGPQS